MSLLINQGKQDTTQDNKFNPIVAKDVLGQITEIKLAKTMASTLEITIRILDGKYKNRVVFDRVSYDPKSVFSWKYRALRKAAGNPYTEGEPSQIDIEALLLNHAVLMDLGIRKGKNKDGSDTDYQNVTYKVVKNQLTSNGSNTTTVSSTTVSSTTDVATVATDNADEDNKTKSFEELSKDDEFPFELPKVTDDTNWG
jgi:hypothetical protein